MSGRANRTADASDFALCQRMIRVAAHLCRQVERDREPGLALLEKIAVATVSILPRCRSRRNWRIVHSRPDTIVGLHATA